MGDRSGVGLVECTILEALDSLGAQPRRHRRSAKVLDAVEERIGLAPGYAYEVLLDLARPWQMPLLLVDGQGNFGTRGNDLAANYRYTEAGLSRLGEVVLAAERGGPGPGPGGADQRQRLSGGPQAAIPPAGNHRGAP
jgi:DNA gyrase subunit A